mmetsp:Transcript_56908/g.106954  ORF Transcript_56908/g.106954 Transcript_56908/m.106954 type:complete len:213 (-) Transcript_56908:671-1309(-)
MPSSWLCRTFSMAKTLTSRLRLMLIHRRRLLVRMIQAWWLHHHPDLQFCRLLDRRHCRVKRLEIRHKASRKLVRNRCSGRRSSREPRATQTRTTLFLRMVMISSRTARNAISLNGSASFANWIQLYEQPEQRRRWSQRLRCQGGRSSNPHNTLPWVSGRYRLVAMGSPVFGQLCHHFLYHQAQYLQVPVCSIQWVGSPQLPALLPRLLPRVP